MLCNLYMFHLFCMNLRRVNMSQYITLHWRARLLPALLLCTRIKVSKINFFSFFFFLMDPKFHGPIAKKPTLKSRRAVGSVSACCLDSHYLEMLNTALNPS